jgi:uncharacterized membrane protein
LSCSALFYSTARFATSLVRAKVPDAYKTYRQALGRAILLGLDFLVAGDIIRTVVVAPTNENVIVLALIVLVRTFLSMALELELEGHWPWAREAVRTSTVQAGTDSATS